MQPWEEIQTSDFFFQVLYRKEIRSFLQHNVVWRRPLAHKKDNSIFREVA